MPDEDEIDFAALYGDGGSAPAADHVAPSRSGSARAPRGLGIEDWHEAQGKLALQLAEAAAAHAALDTRLRHGARAWHRRIAHAHLLRLAWHFGPRLRAEHSVLMAEAAVAPEQIGDDHAALLLQWGLRQLTSSGLPLASPEDLWRRLMPGRSWRLAGAVDRMPPAQAHDDRAPPGWMRWRPVDEGQAAVEDWRDLIAGSEALHPVARGAYALFVWRALDLDLGEPDLVGAVAASMHPAGQGFALGFVPSAGLSGQPWLQHGSATDRLQAWLVAVVEACRSHLMEIERLEIWHRRCQAAAVPRSAAPVIDLLATSPFATVGMAMSRAGLTRPTAQRAFLRLQALGLARPVEDKTRYRFWVPALGSPTDGSGSLSRTHYG